MKIKTKQHYVSMWRHYSQGVKTHRIYSGVNREGASDKAVATREVPERKIRHQICPVIITVECVTGAQ